MDHLAVEAVHDAGLPNCVAWPARDVIVVIVIFHTRCRLHIATGLRTALMRRHLSHLAIRQLDSLSRLTTAQLVQNVPWVFGEQGVGSRSTPIDSKDSERYYMQGLLCPEPSPNYAQPYYAQSPCIPDHSQSMLFVAYNSTYGTQSTGIGKGTFIMSTRDCGRMGLMPSPISSTDRICTGL